jgi:subtilisin
MKMTISRIIALLAALTILVLCGLPLAAQPIPGRHIAVFAPGVPNAPQAAEALSGQFGLELSFVYQHSIRGFAFAGPEQAAQALARNPLIAYIEQDQLVHASSHAIPTGVRRIGIDETLLTHISPERANVDARIAILDTGLDRHHPDLNIDPEGVRVYMGQVPTGKGKQTQSGIVYDDNWDDDNGHGTHVGGTAAANGQIVGVAPGARLTAVKVLGANGSGSTSLVIAGVDWVADNADRFDAANMSLGGGFSQASNDAVRKAVEKGVVFTVSAGNNGGDAGDRSPASEPTAITVSAMADFDGQPGALSSETWSFTSNACKDPETGEVIPQRDDVFACWSNWGPIVDVAAPGVRILSTWLNGTYHTISGTSMAAPHVAGAAALYIAKNREAVSQLQGLDRVNYVTQAITSSGWQFGDYGYFTGDTDGIPEPLLNARALLGGSSPDFTVTITAPADGSEFEAEMEITFNAAAEVNGEDWTDYIAWTSNIDGTLGVGGSVTATLSDGFHTITASVTDEESAFSGWHAINIIVGDPGEIPPPPSGPAALIVEVWTDKPEYVHGETMWSYTRVTDSVTGLPVEAASVDFQMVDAKGGRWSAGGETDAEGMFAAYWKVNANRGGRGTYYITATVRKEGYANGRGTTTFVVK